MITELTKKQTDLFPVYKEKWLKLGLGTDRINREKAIEAINTMYEYGGEYYSVEKEVAKYKSGNFPSTIATMH